MTIPIACSLADTAARSQLEEWRSLLASAAVSAHRPCPTELSVVLRPDLLHLAEAVRLAQREKACCPFFGFAIRIEADTVTLCISVPDDAVALLNSFAAPGSGSAS